MKFLSTFTQLLNLYRYFCKGRFKLFLVYNPYIICCRISLQRKILLQGKNLAKCLSEKSWHKIFPPVVEKLEHLKIKFYYALVYWTLRASWRGYQKSKGIFRTTMAGSNCTQKKSEIIAGRLPSFNWRQSQHTKKMTIFCCVFCTQGGVCLWRSHVYYHFFVGHSKPDWRVCGQRWSDRPFGRQPQLKVAKIVKN